MKKTLLLTSALMVIAVSAFSQGTIRFVPNIANQYTTRVYDLQPDPLTELHGRSTNGLPAGTTVYNGAPLSGTGFTVTLWAGTSSNSLSLVPGTTLPFRTGGAAGLWSEPASTPIPGFAPGTTPVLLVRAWNNLGGTVTDWASVLANPLNPRGDSLIFNPTGGLGGIDDQGNVILPPTLRNMESFNLHIVPEPSVIALGVLGLGALLLRRRK